MFSHLVKQLLHSVRNILEDPQSNGIATSLHNIARTVVEHEETRLQAVLFSFPIAEQEGTHLLIRVASTSKLTTSLTAEAAIKQEETKPGFSLTLLQIVASDSYEPTTRLASALFFKNFIKRNWTVRLLRSLPRARLTV